MDGNAMKGIAATVAVLVLHTSAATVRAEGMSALDLADLPPLPELGGDTTEQAVAMRSAQDVAEDVVSGAAKREQTLGSVTSAVTVISGERLRRFGYRHVADALRAVAGMFVVDDRQMSRPGFRGMQLTGDWNTHFLVLVDGATMNDAFMLQGGVDWNVPVTIDEIARIEVIRGPVSSMYGTSAFFGILNIVTKDATDAPRVWARATAGTITSAGTTAGFSLGELDRQLRGSMMLYRSGGEDVEFREVGRTVEGVDGTDHYQGSLVGRLGGAFGQVRAYRKKRGWALAPFDSEIGSEVNQIWDTGGFAEVGYTQDSGALTVTGRSYAGYYEFEDWLLYPGDGVWRDFGGGTWAGAEVRASRSLFDERAQVTTGVEVTLADTQTRNHFEGMEDEGVLIDTRYHAAAAYAELDVKPFPWAVLTAGVRGDHNSVFSRSVSPRAALLLNRGNAYGLKLLYAEGFRNATVWEAYFDDGLNYAGNPALGPERIHSYEAVVWSRPRPGISLRGSLFRWDASNLIEQDFIGVGGEMRIQFQNLSRRSTTGVELEATYRDASGWMATTGGVLAAVEDPASGARVVNAPAVTATASVSSPRLLDLAHLSTEAYFVGARATRDPMIEASPFVGWNLTLHAPDVAGVDVTLGARNLLGIREQVVAPEEYDRTDIGDVLVSTVPGEGRELYVRIGIGF